MIYVLIDIALLIAFWVIYFVLFNVWYSRRTRGNAYFRLPLSERRRFRQIVRTHSVFLHPLAVIIAVFVPDKRMKSFENDGIHAPAMISSPAIFGAARDYRPDAGDIFVATQMKCGTTWMQQIVYEILMDGRGDFSDRGHGHLYNTSPWIEANQSVSMADAPHIGPDHKRLIKTHLPTKLCPYSPEARYIYVARHPVSCFASCKDFIEMLAGPFAPDINGLLDWFCSDRMYWGPWPDHVAGWWQWSLRYDNVLFVDYEVLKEKPADAIQQVAGFLGKTLTPATLGRILEKVSFEYMQEHEYYFDMSPPNLFSEASRLRFFQNGRSGRHEDVQPEMKQRIVDFCRTRLAGSEYLVRCPYRDLTKTSQVIGFNSTTVKRSVTV